MTLFSGVSPLKFEGPRTVNEFAYRVYEKNRVVLNRRMEDCLRIAVCYWHSFSWPGTDMFGAGTLARPWQGLRVTQEMAQEKLNANLYQAHLGGIDTLARALLGAADVLRWKTIIAFA